ncbi:MAG: hypothetical protein PHN72_03680 [Bacilli bacterium]|nr:hypothetical protein [Bacilli bacterium]
MDPKQGNIVDEFVRTGNCIVEKEEALKELAQHFVTAKNKMKTSERVLTLVRRVQAHSIIENDKKNSLTLKELFEINNNNNIVERNAIRVQLDDVQLKKVECLKAYYENGNKNIAVDAMRVYLNKEAALRQQLLMCDLQARRLRRRYKAQLDKKEFDDREFLMREQESLLGLDYDKGLSLLPDNALLNPQILYCYALELALVVRNHVSAERRAGRSY